jgi:tRNA-dihydrouridine synthase A
LGTIEHRPASQLYKLVNLPGPTSKPGSTDPGNADTDEPRIAASGQVQAVELDKHTLSNAVIDRRFSVAPMMACTDRHARYFLRALSRHALLYTEMVTTGALIHGDRHRYLRFDPSETPIAAQLGGADPQELARCAKMVEDYGYDEVNLNVGCPSERVRTGRFGAALMAEPEVVAQSVAAMSNAVEIPVTVKCRIGIDDLDSYEHLCHFIRTVASAGCDTFVVHARKAWLNGLSPKQNREIPPLRYDVVYQLAADFPELTLILNGGITTIDGIKDAGTRLHGAMVGREAYSNPCLLADIDSSVYGDAETQSPTRSELVDVMVDYAKREIGGYTRIAHIARHMLGLYQGVPGARQWRRTLSETMHNGSSGPQILLAARGAAEAAAQATLRAA